MKHSWLVVLVLCAGAGVLAGLMLPPAWATSCGCIGESWTLALEGEDLDSCAPDASDLECDGRWREEGQLWKRGDGVTLFAYSQHSMQLELQP